MATKRMLEHTCMLALITTASVSIISCIIDSK